MNTVTQWRTAPGSALFRTAAPPARTPAPHMPALHMPPSDRSRTA
ncbi:hypothetical protein ACWD0J_41055 [Streptomyces sp. NPDC003011]